MLAPASILFTVTRYGQPRTEERIVSHIDSKVHFYKNYIYGIKKLK